MRQTHLGCLAAVLLPALAPNAAWSDTSAALCREAAVHAAAETGVPANVLLALTLTETGRALAGGEIAPSAWALNEGGRSHWFGSRDDALDYLAEAVAQGTTNIDIGCFQLNYRWHAEAFATLEDMIEPKRNALHAARYLRSLYERTGDWVTAAGAYHSRTPEFAERYLARFEPILESLGGAAQDLPDTPMLRSEDEDAGARANLFPLLVRGGEGQGASLVPLGDAARPLIGGS